VSELSDFAPFGTTIIAIYLAIRALRRGRVFNLSRSDEPVGYWVFVIGFVAIGLASTLVALLYDPVGAR
jgi:hypothetical protein